MRKLLSIVVLACAACSMYAQEQAVKSRIVEEGGTGPCKAIMKEEPSLVAHTVFAPQDLSAFGKKQPLPVLVWGNGACT
ncbi:MAG: hypothetical protein IJ892_02670, partial [Prevotella sp.]|nr:hypothetical protein [Prevotella sp.]